MSYEEVVRVRVELISMQVIKLHNDRLVGRNIESCSGVKTCYVYNSLLCWGRAILECFLGCCKKE